MSTADRAPPLHVFPRAPARTDRDLYLIECYGPGRFSTYFPDRRVSTMTLEETVADILSGEVEDVAAVFTFNPVEGWARDVSEDIARAVAELAANTYTPLGRKVLEFVESAAGMHVTRGLEVVR